MSILSGYKKVKDRILTSSGYQLLSRWTSSNTVDFDDGKTAQTKVGAINGIIKDKNSLSTVTDDSFAAGAVAVKDAIADVNSKLSGLKFASISTSVTLLVTNRQSLLGSLSDFGLPSNANVFGVFVNCNWAVNVRLAINGNFYAYQIATVSNDATFTLNFVVAYK